MAGNDKDNGPLKVLIIGAGIAGLTAAVGLREAGHEVTLFERSQLAKEVGAAIHIAPNCYGILKRLGIVPEELGANPMQGLAEYNGLGELLKDIDLRGAAKLWQHPWVLIHRVSLHDELKRKATSPTGRGPAAVLKTGARVAEVHPETASITLEDGTKHTGDLVLGADGVSSVARKAIVGNSIKPFDSGKSAFRFLIPRQAVLDNPATAHLAGRDGIMMLMYGSDRRLVMYPCANNTMMNFVAIFPSELSPSTQSEGWSQDGSKSSLLELYRDFGPAVRELLGLVDSRELKLWTLLDMEQLPTWVKGKLALLGDAAHPFLPHQGQGGGIAIEDSASICALLPEGTPRHEIPERLALYEKIRMYRAHKVQEGTRRAGADLKDAEKGGLDAIDFNNYNFAHDEWDNTSHELKKWLWSRNGNTYWRQPTAFGPMTSPRQDHWGRPVPSANARFRTYATRFKTSSTYLKTLFPSPAFSFAVPGTVVEASFKCTELSRLDWLGGESYRSFGLWVHGVQYTKSDGSKLFGSYLPVLFESLADPIASGREELGMPTVFCDIDVRHGGQTCQVLCSWRGKEFARLTLDGLQEQSESNGTAAPPVAPAAAAQGPAPPMGFRPVPDNGVFVYRYVPAVGHKGQADADYPVFISNEGSSTPRVVTNKLAASTASIVIQSGDETSLPTLQHITSALAEIPVYDMVRATVEEGFGVEDLSQAERIE